MKIAKVEAYWLRCPIPPERWHTSDFGTLKFFDACLVVVTTEDGRQGFGEAKGGVGSMGNCAGIVATIQQELGPQIIGQDARHISKIWAMMYNGSRDHYSLKRGRNFPILGRRGLTISAISGIDMALWDLLGQSLNAPIVQLLGGACREEMPCYASGGWADVDGIGEQVSGYVAKGFTGVKMRVGVMDGSVNASVARVKAAREALGPDIKLMTDAHGTFSVAEAKQYCRKVEDCDLYWLEEPVNSDSPEGTAEVRRSTSIPIAVGESESTSYDIRELIHHRACDVLQPDTAIIGGITEAQRVANLAQVHQLELAPHLWGSAFSFMAGLHIAFANPAACILEFSLGGNPMLYDLVDGVIRPEHGHMKAPDKPGLGVTPNWDFVKEYAQ
ncbi:MAG: mandelate racemase/muconate lactonizing enzyme family protein [Bacteroidota bacterium]